MAYQPNNPHVNMSAKPTIICGPSGVGKGTLYKTFQARFPQTMSMCVSHTTRAPRKGEVDGVHYHFVTKQEFNRLDECGSFVETTHFADKSYGTSFQAMRDVMRQNKICLLEIHYTAAIKITKLIECNCIFVTTSGGLETLKHRLIGRDSETAQQIERRLDAAREEFDFVESRPDFFDLILYNDDIDETVSRLAYFLAQCYPDIVRAPKFDTQWIPAMTAESKVDGQREEVHCTLM